MGRVPPVDAEFDLPDVVKARLAVSIETPGDVLNDAVVAVGGGGGATDPEIVRDTIAAALLAGSARITITINDAGDTITLDVPAASATVVGAVELATSAETITGSDSGRAVTPAGLAAKVASETAAGIQEFATAAESVTGASSALSVHPAGLLATRGLYVGVNAQTGTTYAPALTDQGKLVTLSNAGAITVTLPSDATTAFPIGAQVVFNVRGAGMATFVAGAGVSPIEATPSAVTRAQYSWVEAVKLAANTWGVVGDLA